MWQKKKKHYLFKGQEKETTRTYTIGGVEGGCLHATNWKRLSRFFFLFFLKFLPFSLPFIRAFLFLRLKVRKNVRRQGDKTSKQNAIVL